MWTVITSMPCLLSTDITSVSMRGCRGRHTLMIAFSFDTLSATFGADHVWNPAGPVAAAASGCYCGGTAGPQPFDMAAIPCAVCGAESKADTAASAAACRASACSCFRLSSWAFVCSRALMKWIVSPTRVALSTCQIKRSHTPQPHKPRDHLTS